MLTFLSTTKASKSRADESDRDHRSVATTWGMNVEDLSIESKIILDGIACFHSERIPMHVILWLVSIVEAGEIVVDPSVHQSSFEYSVVGELSGKYTLLTCADEGRSYSMHRLLQLVVRSRDGANRKHACTNAIAALYAECRQWSYQTVVDATHEARKRMTNLFSHMQSALAAFQESVGDPLESDISPSTRQHIATLFCAMGFIQQFSSDYTGALASLTHCRSLLERGEDTQDSSKIAEVIQQIGHVLTSKGNYFRAKNEYAQALEIKKKIFGNRDHLEIATSYHRLGTVLAEVGDVASAYEHFHLSLAMKRRIYGVNEDHREIASTLHRIGNMLHRMKHHADALEHYQQSINMVVRMRGTGVDHAGIAYSLHDQGVVLQEQGDLDGALAKYVAMNGLLIFFGIGFIGNVFWQQRTIIQVSFYIYGQQVQSGFRDAKENLRREESPRHCNVAISHRKRLF